MADGFELEALVNLYTIFHDHPLRANGVSVLVEGWDQRLVITLPEPSAPVGHLLANRPVQIISKNTGR
jgi:hypothetical protein